MYPRSFLLLILDTEVGAFIVPAKRASSRQLGREIAVCPQRCCGLEGLVFCINPVAARKQRIRLFPIEARREYVSHTNPSQPL